MQLPCSRLSENSAPRGPSASPAFISVYPPPAGILFPRMGWSHSVSNTSPPPASRAPLTVSMRSLGTSAGDVRGWQGGMSLQGVGRRREGRLSSDRLFLSTSIHFNWFKIPVLATSKVRNAFCKIGRANIPTECGVAFKAATYLRPREGAN